MGLIGLLLWQRYLREHRLNQPYKQGQQQIFVNLSIVSQILMKNTGKLLIICLLLVHPLLAQTSAPVRFGNEWINFQQTYFKIPTAQTGLYRISTADLQKVGFPTNTVDPTTVQLWHRGREQAIFVNGEADKKFDPADYIEFYGRQNDGVADSSLYRPASAQPHPFYSLFSDTTAYFLTWRLDAQPGKRMASYTDTDFGNLLPETYHWEESLKLFTDTYPGWAAGIPPKVEYGHFEAGEGYTSVVYQINKTIDNSYSLTNPARSGPSPKLDVLYVGRDFTNHYVEVQVGPLQANRRVIDTTQIANDDNARLQRDLRWSDIGSDGQFWVGTTSRGDAYTTVDRYSISYMKLSYPQRTSVNSQSAKTFRLATNAGGRSLLNLTEVPANTVLLDVTDPMNPIRVSGQVVTNGLNVVIRNANVARTVFAANTGLAAVIRPVKFRQIDPKKHNYLILTNPLLRKPAGGEADVVKAYATYRASVVGGKFDTLTINVGDVFDQFNSGERGPTGIHRFADYMLAGGSPQYLLLLGRSKSVPGVRKNAQQADIDLVPTYGFPGSDPLLTAGLNGQPVDVPAIPLGRVTANTPAEIMAYLNKVKEFEALPTGLAWRKNVLALSGGHDQNEIGLFRSLQRSYGGQINGPALGANLFFKNKLTDDPTENANVQSQVNAGAGVLSFFGHSGLIDTDFELGLVSDDVQNYRNKGKYPFVHFSGCAVGNFFYGAPTMSTDWLLTPDRGAIAVLAQSHLGYVNVLNNYATNFYNLLADSTMLNQPIGRWQQETIRRTLAVYSSGLDVANAQQMVLQGDPAIRIFPFTKPDYLIPTGGITVRSLTNKTLTTLDDSVKVGVVVQNAGQSRMGSLPVQIKRTSGTGDVTVYNRTWPNAVAFQDTIYLNLPNARNDVGVNTFEVTINPGNKLPEVNFANNTAVLQLNIGGPGALPILPTDFAIVPFTTASPTVTLLAQPLGTLSQQFVIEVDTVATFTSGIKQSVTVSGASGLLNFKPTLLNADTTTYFWRVRYANTADQIQNPWAASSFTVMRNGPTGWTQRKAAQLDQNTIDNQTLTTGLIGPAANWQSLRLAIPDKNLTLEIIGANAAGQESVLFSTRPAAQQQVLNLPANVANQLRLRLRGTQPRQGLSNWLVSFGPVAEGQTLANAVASVGQGQSVLIPVRFANLGTVRFTDSLVVEQTLYAPASIQSQTRRFRIAAPAPGDTARFSIPISTSALPGQNHLLVTVNPRQQAEQTFVNNTVDVPFLVRPDQFGPVLDMTFDGVKIQDGDPVSAAPVLDILVTDDNQYFIRRDTVGLDLYLQSPGVNKPFVRQRWQTTGLSTQVVTGANAFRIRYPMPPLAEGLYKLRLTGSDALGNPSAPYQIGFQVTKAHQIIGVWAAPNPFRDVTRFQLTLTGDTAPDQIGLTITDALGRQVRSVSLPPRVGVNEFLWDGTTESGASLPTGVYVYKFTVTANGSTWPTADAVRLNGRVLLNR